MSPRVSVIVPARDAGRTLPRTLSCLAAQSGDYEIVVVDDGSTDDTASIASRAGARVISASGVGSGAARNLGVRAASGDLIAFTDADCFPEPGWLAAGVARLSDVDLVAGSVRPDPTAVLGPFDRTVWVERETGLYETANLFIRRSLFERIGGFEAWLTDSGPKRGWTNPELGEDVWLGWRARRAGGRSAFEPRAVVYHAVHRRGPAGYVSERQRVRHFPAMAARVPELRDQFFYRRAFLSKRSAMFDAAVVGATVALVTGSKLPLLAAAPYARQLARRGKPYRRRAPLVAAVDFAADSLTLASLARGSVSNRTLVI
jgi:glycosyltransferase involved in cell wall biosynthesis